jgi:hypothetical protein
MSPTARDPGSSPPTPRQIADLLGTAHSLWSSLHAGLAAAFGPLDEKWSYSRKTERWSVQLASRRKKRAIVYLTPCGGHFIASFALGEKACLAARAGGLPATVLEAIDAAPRYPEGRGVRLEVRTGKDLDHVEKIAVVKMAN